MSLSDNFQVNVSGGLFFHFQGDIVGDILPFLVMNIIEIMVFVEKVSGRVSFWLIAGFVTL